MQSSKTYTPLTPENAESQLIMTFPHVSIEIRSFLFM